MVISDKFKHTDDYKEDDIVKPLCFPQMNGYIKYFKNGGIICLL